MVGYGYFPKIRNLMVIIFVFAFLLVACDRFDAREREGAEPQMAEGMEEVAKRQVVEETKGDESPETLVPFRGSPSAPIVGKDDLQNTILMFAIDESTSMSTGGCSQGTDRYKIPNLFLPMFGQYYSPFITGVTPMTDQAPWIEVTYWPLNDDANQSTIGPLRASELSENERVQPRGQKDGAFFDDLFEYMHALPNFPEGMKPTKKVLILFTDGSFHPLYSDPIEAEAQAEGHRNATVEFLDTAVDIHVVLLCPDQLDGTDHDWWISRAKEGIISLYEYAAVEDVARQLWTGVLQDIFPYHWGNGWQGIYLITGDGYWDMTPGDTENEKTFRACRDAQKSQRCLEISLAPMTSGFIGGMVSLSNNDWKQPLPFIWSDWSNLYNFKIKSHGKQGTFFWDEAVSPNHDCGEHQWVLFPTLRSDNLALFWWRAAMDVELSLEELNPLETHIYFKDGQILEDATVSSFVRLESLDIISIENMALCYEEILWFHGDAEDIELSRNPLQEKVNWNISQVLDQLSVEDEISPLESNPPDNMNLMLGVTLDYFGSDGVANDMLSDSSDWRTMNVGIRYIPGFLMDKYQPCDRGGETDANENWQCSMEIAFRYLDDLYYLEEVRDNAYRPQLIFLDRDGEECSASFSIKSKEAGGGGLEISETDQHNQNDDPSNLSKFLVTIEGFDYCDNIQGFRIIWPGWSQGILSDYKYRPQNVECDLYQPQCEFFD